MLIVYINNGLKCLKRKANNCTTFLLTHALVMQGNIYKVKFTKQLQRIWPWSMLASLVRVLCWNAGSDSAFWSVFSHWAVTLTFTCERLMLKHPCSPVHIPKAMWHWHYLMPPGYFHATGNSFLQRLCSAGRLQVLLIQEAHHLCGWCLQRENWITERSKIWIMQDPHQGGYPATGRLEACFSSTMMSRRLSGTNTGCRSNNPSWPIQGRPTPKPSTSQAGLGTHTRNAV